MQRLPGGAPYRSQLAFVIGHCTKTLSAQRRRQVEQCPAEKRGERHKVSWPLAESIEQSLISDIADKAVKSLD